MGVFRVKGRWKWCSVVLLAGAMVPAFSGGQDAPSLAQSKSDQASPQSKLETAIAEAVRLLEAKEYKKFLESFVAPEDLKRITEQVPLEVLAEQFGRERAGHVLKVLRSIEKAKPQIDPNSREASFTIEQGLQLPGREKMVFIQVGGLWYIRN